MKKRMCILVFVLTLCLSGSYVHAAEKNNLLTIYEYFDLFLEEVKDGQNEESVSLLKDSLVQLIEEINPKDVEKILDYMEEKIKEGKWESEKDIEEAIDEAEKEFEVTITKEQRTKIMSLISEIKKLGLKPEYILKLVENIYIKYGEELKSGISEKKEEMIEEIQIKIKEEINKSITDYFSDMVSNVRLFFKEIFSR